MNMRDHMAKVRGLNDRFRTTGRGGRTVITDGVQASGAQAVAEIIAKIRAFNDFAHADDPYRQHDVGLFDHDGRKIFFKIECYDRTFEYPSADPSNPKKTARILTVMFASEY